MILKRDVQLPILNMYLYNNIQQMLEIHLGAQGEAHARQQFLMAFTGPQNISHSRRDNPKGTFYH